MAATRKFLNDVMVVLLSKCTSETRGGGGESGKCIPLLGRHCETPTLSGTTTGKTIPFLAHILILPSVALNDLG